jgi:hypothetical protein
MPKSKNQFKTKSVIVAVGCAFLIQSVLNQVVAQTSKNLRSFDGTDTKGKVDILWKNKRIGRVVAWFMNGTTLSNGSVLDPDGRSFPGDIKGVADFNGDGKPDLLVRKSTGENTIWLMDGLTRLSSVALPIAKDTQWDIKGIADFNGDGKPDILWRHPTGPNVVWLMNGTTITTGVNLKSEKDAQWDIKGVADFNGDGKPDILWRHPTGPNVVWLMNGTTITTGVNLKSEKDAQWDIKGVADFNGDGKPDILWRHPTGPNVVWLMNGTTITNGVDLNRVEDSTWDIVAVFNTSPSSSLAPSTPPQPAPVPSPTAPTSPPVPISSLPPAPAPNAAFKYYISPAGNDGNPGTSEDRPFRSIEHARDVIRASKGSMTKDIVVFLRAGNYRLSNTLTFNEADSGNSGYKVIYRSYPGERASLSGGHDLGGWIPSSNGVYKLATNVPTNFHFRQLYINGKKAVRARTPDEGSYFRMQGWDAANQLLRLNSTDLVGSGAGDEVVIQRSWNQNRLRIMVMNFYGGNALVAPMSPERNVAFNLSALDKLDGQAYHLEGNFNYLNAPGEWFENYGTGEVFYKPRPGENLSDGSAVAPALETILSIKGTPTNPVHDIQFYGLTFEHSTWLAPDTEGYVGTQAGLGPTNAPIASAITVNCAKNIRFERNVMQHFGGNGLTLVMGSQSNQIVGNVVTDVAANGISEEYLPRNSGVDGEKMIGDVIQNNYLTQIAQEYYGSVGIYTAFVDSLRIEHNEVSYMPYSGISVGWGSTLGSTNLKNNSIRYNNVHHVLTLLHDGGGIYTQSKQPGTVIDSNYVHDIVRSVWTHVYPVAGIYLDNGSSNIQVSNNVLPGTTETRAQGGLPAARLYEPIYVQFLGTPAQNNNIFNNDGQSSSVIQNSGIEPSYADIKNGF